MGSARGMGCPGKKTSLWQLFQSCFYVLSRLLKARVRNAVLRGKNIERRACLVAKSCSLTVFGDVVGH